MPRGVSSGGKRRVRGRGLLDLLGLGRRKKRVHRRKGGARMLSGIYGGRRVVRPRGAGLLGNMVGLLGLGRKRRMRRGRGLFGNILSKAKSAIGSVAGAVVPKLADKVLDIGVNKLISKVGGKRRRKRRLTAGLKYQLPSLRRVKVGHSSGIMI